MYMINSKDKCGISILSLVITIIVMIILAAVVIFHISDVTKQSLFAKYGSEVSGYEQQLVDTYETVNIKLTTSNGTPSRQRVYYSIANNIDEKDIVNSGEECFIPTGDLATLNNVVGIKPTDIIGVNFYLIQNDKKINGINGQQNFTGMKDEWHFISDYGEAFVLPGMMFNFNDEDRWYVNEEKYYVGGENDGIIVDKESGKLTTYGGKDIDGILLNIVDEGSGEEQVKKIIVTFDSNGGTDVTVKTKEVKYNDTYGELENPTKEGYTFEGWYTAQNGGTQVTSTTKVTVKSDQTLYAHWNANTYKITFDANDGSVDTANKVVSYDGTYGTLPVPTRTDYTFEGWYTGKEDGDKIESTTSVKLDSDQTLYAHWKLNNFTITFNANNGNVSPSSKKVAYNENYGTLPTPTRTGYNFKGWYTDISAGSKIESTTKVTIQDNQTLFAHWEVTTYTITFNPNGGNVSPTSKTVEYDGIYGTLPTPTKTGYTFDGWYTDISAGTTIESTTNVNIESNQTLYARWSANEYTVTFNAGEGTVSPTTKKVKYDGTYGDLPTPTRTNYDFEGWYTSGNAKVESTTTFKITDNITLNAKWLKSAVTFTINSTTSDAVVKINGQTTTSVNAKEGTSVSWSVEKPYYTSKSGTYTLGGENYTMDVGLVEKKSTTLTVGPSSISTDGDTDNTSNAKKKSDEEKTKYAICNDKKCSLTWNFNGFDDIDENAKIVKVYATYRIAVSLVNTDVNIELKAGTTTCATRCIEGCTITTTEYSLNSSTLPTAAEVKSGITLNAGKNRGTCWMRWYGATIQVEYINP